MFLCMASKHLIRLVSSLIYYLSLKFVFESQVTGVGVNTEWGLLMASVSEDNGGETPLQVSINFSLFIFLWYLLLNIYPYFGFFRCA